MDAAVARSLLIGSKVGPMRFAYGRSRRVLIGTGSNEQLACNRTGRVMCVRVTTTQAVLVAKISRDPSPQARDVAIGSALGTGGIQEFVLLPDEALYAALAPGFVGTKLLLVSEGVGVA